ncbi:hypothetical protein FISHEDRAFT_61129 [Fistulina hepatica ATCC 64428]|uniref:HMG box domain-containing protein n=1 Tax=Fistulina hepatica ATCC 64428 TaxID=1128425 RepID=A0A0D7A3V4_9AGAR|nr:hypothetical protein FISHEDRAFT_61129 [Fistulina hepatica ATCC 64428]
MPSALPSDPVRRSSRRLAERAASDANGNKAGRKVNNVTGGDDLDGDDTVKAFEQFHLDSQLYDRILCLLPVIVNTPRHEISCTRGRRGKLAPPRPMNAFIYFRSCFWALVRGNEVPTDADHRRVSCTAAQLWHELSEDRRVPFRCAAQKAQDAHAAKYPNFRYKPPPTVGRSRASKRRAKRAFGVAAPRSTCSPDISACCSRSPSSDVKEEHARDGLYHLAADAVVLSTDVAIDQSVLGQSLNQSPLSQSSELITPPEGFSFDWSEFIWTKDIPSLDLSAEPETCFDAQQKLPKREEDYVGLPTLAMIEAGYPYTAPAFATDGWVFGPPAQIPTQTSHDEHDPELPPPVGDASELENFDWSKGWEIFNQYIALPTN